MTNYENTWGQIDWDDGKPEEIKKQVQSLIDQGADVNATDRLGKSPLTKALRHQYFDIADVLVVNGAKPTFADLQFFMGEFAKSSQEVETTRLAMERKMEIAVEKLKSHTR
ncbi:MAG: ankyrin repeat domain-containing protein [Alphaproteobacteria bacterium]|nr:ankyrin repeat domain-containing protein [Alphaproteobacteria bacterium]